MTNLEILEEEYIKGMKHKGFQEFMETFPTLLKVILKAMERVRLNDTRLSKSSSK